MLDGAAKDDSVKYDVAKKVNKIIFDHNSKVGSLNIKNKNVEETQMFNELV